MDPFDKRIQRKMLDDDKTFDKVFWIVMIFVFLGCIVLCGIGIWAVIELVNWVTSK
jgi:hypothetical protein